MLDYYMSIRDAVSGRIANATTSADVAAALRGVLAGVWMELADPPYKPLEPGEQIIRAEFELRRQIDGVHPVGVRLDATDLVPVTLAIRREPLPELGEGPGWLWKEMLTSRPATSTKRPARAMW
jgi:hypothetical protein